MKKTGATIYAIVATLLLATGFLLAFYFSQKQGIEQTVACIVGLVLGFALAPIVHETGHIVFARVCGMRIVYAKFFCFKLYEKTGKIRFGFASPFTPDQTQAIPTSGGDMLCRAKWYTLGGLIFSGAFLLVALAIAIATNAFLVWGVLPYAGYLLLLNIAPCVYASGKTDMLVYLGLKKGEPAEKTMLSAMEIQGRLYQGARFSEIDKALYFDLPQLPEDESLYAVMLDLRYRYYLDKGEEEKAWDCLNRLVNSQEYLSAEELQKLSAELVYAYALQGDRQNADNSGKYAQDFLRDENATAKRVLLAYTLAFGGEEKSAQAQALKAQAETAIANEKIQGIAKLEKTLVQRME